MRTIYKYPLEATDEQKISMPVGAQILCVQTQGDQPCLWALVDTQAPQTARVIRTYGTGHPVDAPGRYIGTYQLDRGALVFHVFEVES